MYEVFEKLCESRNVTPYKVSKETGVSRSTLSDWKKGRSRPKIDKLHLRITEMRHLLNFCNIICNIKQKAPTRTNPSEGKTKGRSQLI